MHEADSSKGYNFPFILIFPEQIQGNVKIFVEGNNSLDYIKRNKDGNVLGYQTFEEQKRDAIAYAQQICKQEDGKHFNLGYMYQKLKQPLVIPIIERCESEYTGEYYTQMLGRNVVMDKTSKFANLSQQVVAVVEEAKKVCLAKNNAINIDKKSGLCGFSTSGVFASRMLFAEPESFDVCLSMCSNAVQPLPVDELDGVKLPYPLGTADYENMFGKPFNVKEYKKARQMFFVGNEEDNQRYNIAKNPRLHDKNIQDKFIQVYGDVTIQERQRMISQIMQKLGMTNTVSLVVPGGHNFGGKSKYILGFYQAISVPNDAIKPLLSMTIFI